MRQATSRSWSRRLAGLMCALALLFMAGLASCGYSVSTQSAAKDTASATPPTATSASGTVTPSIEILTTEIPTSTAGWQTYTDTNFHFKTVIPPGWRLVTALDTTSAPQCEYDAVYFPPGDTRAFEPRVWVGMREYMRTAVYLQCPPFDPTQDQYLSTIGPVTISGVATTLYYGEDNNLEVDRDATVVFGGHSYTFYLVGQSKQGTATRADIPLYMRVLQEFVYLGGK